MKIKSKALEFEWDRGNTGKNKKHSIEDYEGEEVFFDEHKIIVRDALHSGKEERFILLGKTKKGRLLFVVFTKRARKIRLISVRSVNKKEARLYEKATSTSAI